MDPVSGLAIASSCMSLATKSGTLILRITIFVSEVRNARRDLDSVSRELTSLQLCLSALKDEQQFGALNLPEDMKNHINQILVNIDLILNQINDMLIKLSSGKLGRRIQWVTTHKEEMNKFRCSLESNKSALEIALTLGSISMLAQQTQSMTKQDGQVELLVQRTESISISTKIIDGKIDALTNMHQGDTRLESITQEISFLRTQMKDLASNTSNATLSAFRKESEAYAQNLLRPIASALPDINTVALASVNPQQSRGLDSYQSCNFCESLQNEMKSMDMNYKEKEDSYQKKLEHMEYEWLRSEARLMEETERRQKAEKLLQHSQNAFSDLTAKFREISNKLSDSFERYSMLERAYREKEVHNTSLLEKVGSYEKELRKALSEADSLYKDCRNLNNLHFENEKHIEFLLKEIESYKTQISDLEEKLRESSSKVNDTDRRNRPFKGAYEEEKTQIDSLGQKIQPQKRPSNVPNEFWIWWSQNFPGRSLSSAGLNPDTYGEWVNEDMVGMMNFNKALQAEYEKSIQDETPRTSHNIPLARIKLYHINTDSPKAEYSFRLQLCFVVDDQDIRFAKWNQNIMKIAMSFSRRNFYHEETLGQLQKYILDQFQKVVGQSFFATTDTVFMQFRGKSLSSASPLHKAHTSTATLAKSQDYLYLMLSPFDQQSSSTLKYFNQLPQKLFVLSKPFGPLYEKFFGKGSGYGAYVCEGSSLDLLFQPKGLLRFKPWPIVRISDSE